MKPILLFFICLLAIGQLAAQPCNLQVTASASDTIPCKNGSVTFYAAANAPASYSWSGPGSFSSTFQNPILTPVTMNHTGSYIVTATSGNCIAQDTIFMTVNDVPQITHAYVDTVVCEGDTLRLWVAGISTTQFYRYIYRPDGKITGSNYYLKIAAALSDSGIYKAVFVSYNGCPSDTFKVLIAVEHSIPTITGITADNNNPSPGNILTYTATATPSGGTPQVFWYKNNQLIPGATGLSYAGIVGTDLKQGDSIYALATADVMCGIPGKSNTIGVKVNLSVNDISSNNISLYPNPTNGTLSIGNDIAVGKPVNITVLNAIGRVMQQTEMSASTDMQLQLSDKLPSGIYLLQVKTGGAVFIARFRLDR